MTESFEYNYMDLVTTTKELIIRIDGFAFDPEEHADKDGRIPRDQLDGAEVMDAETLCTFLRYGEEDATYGIVRKDILGRGLTIPLKYLKLLSSVNDAESE